VTDPIDAPSLFPDDRPDIPTDDWEDQDLLTKDEARLRLEAGLRVVNDQLARLPAGDSTERSALEDQIAKINRVLGNLAK
jgi:hypothetical protein